MVDYYQRKARAYQLIKKRIKGVMSGEIEELDVDSVVDEIVENDRLAISEHAVIARIDLLCKRLPNVTRLGEKVIRENGKES